MVRTSNFQVRHLDIDERSERIAAQAEGLDLSRYADVYDSISGGGSTLGALDSAVIYTLNERFEVMVNFSNTVKRQRVLVIDDGQWGPESLSFVRYLRRRHNNMPVLVLVTLRIDALSRRSPQAASLSQLASDADTLDIRLGPLAKEAHRELLVSRLVLDPEVVAYLEKRTHGNPLFTEELVRHWIRSEILEPGPRGFRLRSTVDNSIPDTIYDVWAMRIDSAFHPSEIDARQSIQIAAVLGHRVSISEWNAVCSRAGLTSTSDILERLLKEQMIDPNIEGEFEFSHVLLRESLQRAAGETGQLANHHSLCADVLLSLEDIEPLRVGEHLFSAQRYEEASEHFGRAALLFGNVSDYAGAQRALDSLGCDSETSWGGYSIKRVADDSNPMDCLHESTRKEKIRPQTCRTQCASSARGTVRGRVSNGAFGMAESHSE